MVVRVIKYSQVTLLGAKRYYPFPDGHRAPLAIQQELDIMYAAMEDNYMPIGPTDKLLAALLIGQRRSVARTGA